MIISPLISIRQPYAELILRRIKPIEFRSRPTTIIGERFYIYASRQWASGKLFVEGCRLPGGSSEEWGESRKEKIWWDDLAMPGDEGGPAAVDAGTGEDADPERPADGGDRGDGEHEGVYARGLSVVGWKEDSDRSLQPTTNNIQPATLYEWHLTDKDSWSTRIRGWYELGANIDRQGRYDQAMEAFLAAKAMIRPAC